MASSNNKSKETAAETLMKLATGNTGPSGVTTVIVRRPHGNFPYNFVPSSEKFFGCCSQRTGCVIIGVSQMILGIFACSFQFLLALVAKGGIDLTKFFGVFPKDESIRKFIFGVSVVDIFTKVIFVLSGIIIIAGAARNNAGLLNAWMCINSYTFASSIATNAAAAGGLISFAESREEYALPLTFDTLLMGAQFYVMTIVKGYHQHLEKAEEALKNALEGKDGKGRPVDDHDIIHSSIKFKCCRCCSYEEELKKQKLVDHVKTWKEAEKERKQSIEDKEKKKLMERAKEAENRYHRLLLQQALRDEQKRRLQNQRVRAGPSGQWHPGYGRIVSQNVRPGAPPRTLTQDGWLSKEGIEIRTTQDPTKTSTKPLPETTPSAAQTPTRPSPKDAKKPPDPNAKPATTGPSQTPAQPTPSGSGKTKAAKPAQNPDKAKEGETGTSTLEKRKWPSGKPSKHLRPLGPDGKRLSEPNSVSEGYPKMRDLVDDEGKRRDSK